MAITTPFWTVKTRLSLYQEQSRVRSNQILKDVVSEMYQKEGIKSFYRGFVPSIFMSTYGVIQMYSYEVLTHTLGYQSGQKMSWDNFLLPFFIGGTSRSIASTALLPLNVVRMRLQMKNYSTEEI